MWLQKKIKKKNNTNFNFKLNKVTQIKKWQKNVSKQGKENAKKW